MTVYELIQELVQFKPNYEVRIKIQPAPIETNCAECGAIVEEDCPLISTTDIDQLRESGYGEYSKEVIIEVNE